MTLRREPDRALVDELVAMAGSRTPDYVEEAVARATRVRQRPAWTFASHWLPATRRARTTLRLLAVTALLGLALVAAMVLGVGSGPTPSPSDGPSPLVSPTPVPSPTGTPVAARDACAGAASSPMTLTAWDQEAGAEVGAVIDGLNAEFEAANPGVTIVRERKAADELAGSVQAALADASGPDVAQVAEGREGMGAAVAAGLLRPLADDAARYGWEERWATGILARTSFGDDGRTWGSGTLYGVAVTGEVVGRFFNYDLGAQRPSRPYPTSLDEELADWAAIAEAGHVPIVLGAADGDAIHVYGTVLQAMVDPAWMDDLVYARNGATFDTPEAVAAAAMLVEMRDLGYFSEGYATASHQDAVSGFRAGAGEFLWTGSWDARDLAVDAPTLIFAALEPAEPDGRARALGGIGMPWVVRRSSANAGCAAAYLDFLTSDSASQLLAASGILPSHYEFGSPEFGSATFQDMASIFRATSREGTLGPRLEKLYPGARESLTTGLARLLSGQVTPEDLVRGIDAERRAYLAGLE